MGGGKPVLLVKFVWKNDCQKAFDILKAVLKNELVLFVPNFAKEFKLVIDSSKIFIWKLMRDFFLTFKLII